MLNEELLITLGLVFTGIVVLSFILYWRPTPPNKTILSEQQEPVFHPPYTEVWNYESSLTAHQQHRMFYDSEGIGHIVIMDHEPWCIKENYRQCSGTLGEEYTQCSNPLRINDKSGKQRATCYRELNSVWNTPCLDSSGRV